jgi:hypothetical protein
MFLLVMAAIGTGVWALVSAGAALSVHLTVDVIAVMYGALLYESRRRRNERRRKVRNIARHPLSATKEPWPDMEHDSVAL